MWFFSLCKIRKLILMSNRFNYQTSVVCVLFSLHFFVSRCFYARQFPFRNQRALWKLYKSVDEAEIGSQLKPVPTLRHHVSVKFIFNKNFLFSYFRIFSSSTEGLDRLPKSYYDSVKLLLRSETGFIVIVRPRHQGLELDKLPVDWGALQIS